MARQPEGPPPPPTVQKLRIRYAKRGRLRFASHRDLARALERALRRAQVPMAFSAGLHPAPEDLLPRRGPDRGGQRGGVPGDRAGRARATPRRCAPRWTPRCPPTSPSWSASRRPRAPARWPTGSTPPPGGSSCPGSSPAELAAALAAFLARDEVLVARRTKNGLRDVDARAAVAARDRGRRGGLCHTAGGRPAGDARCSTRRRVGRSRRRRRPAPAVALTGRARGAGPARRRRDRG